MIGHIALAGAGVGAGLAVIAWGLFPPRRPLAAALDRPRIGTPLPGRRARLVQALQQRGLPPARLLADLAVCETDPAAHVAAQLTYATIGLAAPAGLFTLLGLVGAGPGLVLPTWMSLACAAAGYLIPDLRVRRTAAARRLLTEHTLSTMLDLVAPALAAGAGVEQAMRDAASVCTGWAADRIRVALATARAGQLPLWQPVDELGTRLHVPALRQLATSLRLASGEGTRIRTAITARADTLAQKITADTETRAASATERMAAPLMLLSGLLAVFLITAAFDTL
ncbi:type II secretion system F family protein [Catellatospora bangladeshensis]|uniref:type II secretion system F family protein n=1 Tax=Catellatospora bangladeshensis TaxID=310355 RepID=UPI001943227F|nr:type II secretion system F family protein [Catellatospora bangladeshensis]